MTVVKQTHIWTKSFLNPSIFGSFILSLCLLLDHKVLMAQDATSQSSRERDRVLLKRSPIASEYQIMGEPGDVLGATFDAEGVDFRSHFSLRRAPLNEAAIKLVGNVNYQSISKEFVFGGGIHLIKPLGKLNLQLHVQRNASERFVESYESRWLLNSDLNSGADSSANEVLSLGYPRFTQDSLQTQSINTHWRADYQVNKTFSMSYDGLNVNYDDVATRNRFETQLGAGELSNTVFDNDGSTINQASVSNAKIRRYFHRLNTARDINRHKLGFVVDKEDGSIEFNAYYSRWVNDKLWLPWNFIESDVSATYTLENRYLPSVNISNSNIYDVSDAIFANYRINDNKTTDTDYAFMLNWDKKVDFANKDLWLETGIAWRNKERAVDNSSAVYGSTSDTFNLAELTNNFSSTRIIENQFLLPAGLGLSNGSNFFTANQNEQFSLNSSQSFLESIQDIYTSEETVSSLYINAYQQRKNWFWRAGLRVEKTDTATRGAVYDSPSAIENLQGEAITSIVLDGTTIAENFTSFDAAFLKGGSNYTHLLPSVELRYTLNTHVLFKGAYFQQLMRPQYFDTVNYRRANISTLSITEGNPDLEATTIENVYAGFEYQYTDQGQLYAGLYYSQVSDFFYDSNTSELIGDELFEVASVENGKEGYIKGLQSYWKQQFSMPVLNHAEVELAYTYSDSEATLSDRIIKMPERADHRIAFNLRLHKNDWQYRSQFSWQSEAIDDVGASASQDTIRESVLIWNQSLSWHYNEDIITRISLNNILDYPERSYQGQPSRVLNNLYSGSTARLSVELSF